MAGDIEICPGSRARCCKCNKRFRRNTDQVICTGCDWKFHKKCLNVVLTNSTCDICLPSQATENIINSIDNSAELRNVNGKPGLSILHQNLRDLFGKVDQIQESLVKHSVNIFGVTETFLINSTLSSFVKIRGIHYTVEIVQQVLEEVLVYTLTTTHLMIWKKTI